MWLGDNPAHDVYVQTKESNKQLIARLTTRLLRRYKGIGSLYPVLGNHDGLPCDHLELNEEGTNWMFEYVAELWAPWLTAECRARF